MILVEILFVIIVIWYNYHKLSNWEKLCMKCWNLLKKDLLAPQIQLLSVFRLESQEYQWKWLFILFYFIFHDDDLFSLDMEYIYPRCKLVSAHHYFGRYWYLITSLDSLQFCEPYPHLIQWRGGKDNRMLEHYTRGDFRKSVPFLRILPLHFLHAFSSSEIWLDPYGGKEGQH